MLRGLSLDLMSNGVGIPVLCWCSTLTAIHHDWSVSLVVSAAARVCSTVVIVLYATIKIVQTPDVSLGRD